MDAIDNLLGRSSPPAKWLQAPAPSDTELKTLFAAAATAPDHGGLQPWRFLLVRGSARQALGDVFAEAYLKREPTVPADKLENYRNKPLRAPLIIVLIARLQDSNPKVSAQEQIISAGIAGQHIQLAAHAMGYASIWLSGINTRDRHVTAALGLAEHEQLLGYLYLGSNGRTASEPPPRPRAQVDEWHGVQRISGGYND